MTKQSTLTVGLTLLEQWLSFQTGPLQECSCQPDESILPDLQAITIRIDAAYVTACTMETLYMKRMLQDGSHLSTENFLTNFAADAPLIGFEWIYLRAFQWPFVNYYHDLKTLDDVQYEAILFGEQPYYKVENALVDYSKRLQKIQTSPVLLAQPLEPIINVIGGENFKKVITKKERVKSKLAAITLAIQLIKTTSNNHGMIDNLTGNPYLIDQKSDYLYITSAGKDSFTFVLAAKKAPSQMKPIVLR